MCSWILGSASSLRLIRGAGVRVARLSRRVGGVPWPWILSVGWSRRGIPGLSGADGGQCLQGGQHMIEEPGSSSRWWPQDESSGGPGEPSGDVDQFAADPGQRAAGPAPRPSSMPVISWIQLEMAQAINAAHIHTVLTVRSPDGR